MRTPKIRFKGYIEDWEQRKLGEMGSLKNGMNFSKDAMGRGYPFVNLQNIFGKNIIDVNNLGKAEASTQQLKEYSLEKGDVLFVRSSVKLEGVGEAAVVPKTLENTTYSGFVIRFRDEVGLDDNFKKFVFSIKSVRDQIMAQATNSANKNVSQTILGNLAIPVPEFEEQEKIGSCFSSLDHLLTLHQRKCEEIKTLKKYMFQKMFPQDGMNIPEIRFAGFTGDWEQRKLSELVEVVDGDRGKNYPIESDFTTIGHTLFLNASNVTTNGFLFLENQYISEEKSNSMGNGRLQEDDIIITSRGSLGHIAWYNTDISRKIPYVRINSGMLILRKREEIVTSYLYHYMKSDKGQNQILFMSFGSAQPQLTKKCMENLKVVFPKDINEQHRLGQYFSYLDHLLTLHQRKCEELKKMKKFMFQNMFV